MSRLGRWLGALVLLVLGRRKEKREEERIIPQASAERGAENAVIVLLLFAILFAVGFVVIYATDSIGNRTQYLGIALGGCLAFVSAALIVISKRLVVTEEIEEEYPEPEEPEEQEKIVKIVDEAGDRFTRKGLMKALGGLTAGAVGAALLTPAVSLGPFLKTGELAETPWRRGRRLVNEKGTPYRASDIEEGTFYTAYPEGVTHELMGSPVVIVRLPVRKLRLPDGRRNWAPGGILAYSKICTHAGCAIALYRKPTFTPTEPRPALVCPCHYSTFDPATGGTVIFGPAGRDLPQLPLAVDLRGNLRALGNFSGPVGPSWAGVRKDKAS